MLNAAAFPDGAPPETTPWCRDNRGNQYAYDRAMELIRDFHGHVAPGLAIGTRMVSLAMEQLPEGILFDAVCETGSCLPDAVQMLTPCTIGNGWLRVLDLGRYAVTLYDKFEGSGVRVCIDSEKLRQWPEFYDWFYKIKEKREQDFDLLMTQIREAGENCLSIHAVTVKSPYLVRRSKGRIATCPLCREAYPAAHGAICRGCQGETPLEIDVDSPLREPVLQSVPAEEAVGRTALHDMTRIEPGVSKGPAVQRGETITAGDLCRLQKMGRQRVFVEGESSAGDEWIHEDEAALTFAGALCGMGTRFDTPPREGKVTLRAARDGLLQVDIERLEAFNMLEGVMCASRRSFGMVQEGDEIAGTRAIPLYLARTVFTSATTLLQDAPLFRVLPLTPRRVGILVTGTEVFRGLIQDRFAPIIEKKVTAYGCPLAGSLIVPDDRTAIAEGVRQLLDAGCELLVTTAGLSVDPDDVTRKGLEDAGCTGMLYGAPILPGAMTLLARIGEVSVMGVPACGLYHPVTSFDLLLPRILAGVSIGRKDLARMGHGAFCRNCRTCTWPRCRFGN